MAVQQLSSGGGSGWRPAGGLSSHARPCTHEPRSAVHSHAQPCAREPDSASLHAARAEKGSAEVEAAGPVGLDHLKGVRKVKGRPREGGGEAVEKVKER